MHPNLLVGHGLVEDGDVFVEPSFLIRAAESVPGRLSLQPQPRAAEDDQPHEGVENGSGQSAVDELPDRTAAANLGNEHACNGN